MTTRSGFAVTCLTCLMLATVGPTLTSAGASDGVSGARASLPELREVLDDPPGQPAPAVPGSQPAPGHRFGRFVSVQVNVDAGGANIPGDAANEPSITVDPIDPLRMAIGWRQFDTVSSNFRQAGRAYSQDGGRTWTFPGVLTPGIFRSDPVLSFDAEGDFYYSSLKSDFTCDLFKSLDGGVTWGPAVPAYGGDKQWIAVDRSGGLGHGHIYSSWSGSGNIFTRSIDGGQSFQPPTPIPQSPRWGTMDVDPFGILYIGGSDSGSTFYVSRSNNAQNPALTPTFTTWIVNLGGSVSGWVGPNPGGLLGQAWLAVDSSDGPRRGWVYMLSSVDPPGSDPLDVHFIRSIDGGTTWSTPIRINDDVGNNWQWFGTMSVSPDGRIDVIWNDSRNTGASNLSELFYSFSDDGGFTWSANEQLSGSWDSHIGWPAQNKIGDYYDMMSDLVGADLAWAATFNGEQDVYYLRINDYDCNQNGIGDATDIASGTSPDTNGNGIPDECEGLIAVPDVAPTRRLLGSAPNPFGPRTTIEFEVVTPRAHVRLSIFDVEGRLVRTLLDRNVSGGPGSALWDGRDDRGVSVPAGTYFCRLEAPGVSETHRLMRIR